MLQTSAHVFPVLSRLVEKVVEQKFLRRGSRSRLMVTVFQLWSYLESNSVRNLETHVAELAEEGTHIYI